MIKLTLTGRPITKKNSQRICWRGKKPILLQSKRYIQYENDCLAQITGLYKKFLSGKLLMTVKYWMPSRQGWPDLTGLMQATADILEKAQVIENDRDIVCWDGTEIAGIDKENPRAEIVIIEKDSKNFAF